MLIKEGMEIFAVDFFVLDLGSGFFAAPLEEAI